MTFITAGYPTPEDTVPIMLAMQEGGADIIELGVPFSDPMADGPAIQETNVVCTHPSLPLYLIYTTPRWHSNTMCNILIA